MMANKIIVQTMNEIQLLRNLIDIYQSFKPQIQSHIIQSMSYTPEQLKRKYNLLWKKYHQNTGLSNGLDWLENQKKIFITLLLAFCYLNTKKISQITDNQWILFSEAFNKKNVLLLRYEINSIQKKHSRVIWNQMQESLLQQYISSHSEIDWNDFSRFLYLQSSEKYFKTPKQCRQHWFNHLDKNILKGNWSIQEDLLILQKVMQKGKKWAQMVSLLQNKRTEHMIKNRFNSLITCAKKLIKINTKNLSQNEIIVFMKQKISSLQQSSKSHSKHRKQIQNLKREDEIMNYSQYKPQLYQFHLSDNQQQQIKKQKLQINQLKIQFCDFNPLQQNFINFPNDSMQELREQIKIEHIQDAENTDKNLESPNLTVQSTINLDQSMNVVGFYPNQFYISQSYNYYYPTIIYPLI